MARIAAEGGPPLLESLFRQALAALDLADATRRACQDLGAAGRPCAAVGKAAATMADGARQAGAEVELVVLPPGARPPEGVEAARVVEASHPVPDRGSAVAGERLVQLAERCRQRGRRLTLLLSGGASALVAAPVPPLTVDDKATVTQALLASGAGIEELNTVRKHLSRLKGGRLAALCAVDLVYASDVIGDDPSVVGSGPASLDTTTPAKALQVLERRLGPGWERGGPGLAAVHRRLHEDARDPRTEASVRPTAQQLADVRVRCVAGHGHLREAARTAARQHGVATGELGPPITGEVTEVAAGYAARAGAGGSGAAAGEGAGPLLLIGGGEPTVAIAPGTDLGRACSGRSAHLALLMAGHLRGRQRVAFLAAGSDGIDGFSPAAGAAVDGRTWDHARNLGLDPDRALVRYEAAPLLEAAGAAIVTGPTGHNLLDLHLLLLG
jgi:hydroxypyruvate reductase